MMGQRVEHNLCAEQMSRGTMSSSTAEVPDAIHSLLVESLRQLLVSAKLISMLKGDDQETVVDGGIFKS